MCYFLFLLLLLIIFFCSVCCCAYQEAMMSAYFVCEWSCNRFQYRNTHSQTQPYRQQTHILLLFILRRLLFRIRFCWLYGRTHWMWLNWSQGSRDMSPQPQTSLMTIFIPIRQSAHRASNERERTQHLLWKQCWIHMIERHPLCERSHTNYTYICKTKPNDTNAVIKCKLYSI